MWTGGKPPPVPTTPAPPDTPTRSYRSERQQTELDQLRQRGLAKLLNKHFTNVTQTLAEERAAADAALRDLEARKKTGKDWDTTAQELSVWDKMYLELQQKKAECKRKERETLLLYQRYVDRFGATGVVAVPKSAAIDADAKASPPFSRDIPSTPNNRVPQLAGDIEANLANLAGNERHPSINFLGVDETYQKAFANMDQQERIAFLRSLEGKGVDARATLGTPSPQPKKLVNNKEGIPESPNLASGFPFEDTPTKDSYITTTTVSTDKQDPPEDDDFVYHGGDLDEDIRSIVSGLTSGDFTDAERVLIDFLKTETEAIKKLLDDEEAMETASLRSYSSDINSQSAKAADEAEDSVKKMEQVLQDFSTDVKTPDEHEPHKLETSDPDEEWMVYWDDMAQRHYYYDKKSHRAQWAKPSGIIGEEETADAVLVSDYTRSTSDRSVLSYEEVTPMDDVPRSSRRDLYRRRRRRRRNRRILLVTLLSVTAIGGSLYANRYHHEESTTHLAKALGSREHAELVIDTIETYLPESVTGRMERTEQKAREENAKKAKQAAERKVKEETERAVREAKHRAQEEKERRAREEQEAANTNVSNPFKEWICQNPHFWLVNSKRGVC